MDETFDLVSRASCVIQPAVMECMGGLLDVMGERCAWIPRS